MILLVLTLIALIIFLTVFLIVGITMLIFDLTLDLPFVRTSNKKIETVLKFADVKKGQKVVDLGSGDGRLLFSTAKKGAISIGYELNPFLFLLSKLLSRINGLSKNVFIKKENMWSASLKDADVIFVFSLKSTIKRFEDFVFKNAKKGTKVVVNMNSFPSKKPQKEENDIFLYIV